MIKLLWTIDTKNIYTGIDMSTVLYQLFKSKNEICNEGLLFVYFNFILTHYDNPCVTQQKKNPKIQKMPEMGPPDSECRFYFSYISSTTLRAKSIQ